MDNVVTLKIEKYFEEKLVVYEHSGEIWSRPLDMFLSEIDHNKYPDAEQKYRFELIEKNILIV